MDILIALLVFCLIAALVYYLIGLLPLPAPFGMIVRVILILIAIVWLVERFGLLSYPGHFYGYSSEGGDPNIGRFQTAIKIAGLIAALILAAACCITAIIGGALWRISLGYRLAGAAALVVIGIAVTGGAIFLFLG